MGRPTQAFLSTENLLHNLQVIKHKAPGSKVIAMVKANAYGHGLRSVALRLDKYVDGLGVASIEEALALRKVGVEAPLLLMEGVFDASELEEAALQGFQVVFHDPIQLQWLNTTSITHPITAWIKTDTGMGRLGFSPEDVPAVYHQLQTCPHIALPVRLMSHLAYSDVPDHPLNTQQLHQFQQLIQQFPTEYSLCNSGAIFCLPQTHYHYIRPGLALYGISPLKDQEASFLNLRPVMTLQSQLIAVRARPKGSFLGYGARYQCSSDMKVGVVACGYGDGYPLSARDGAPILVNNTICPLVGRVSMDMLMVDLRPCPQAKVGDPVVLWGEGLPLEQLVPYTTSSVWDLPTGVLYRVKFVWSS